MSRPWRAPAGWRFGSCSYQYGGAHFCTRSSASGLEGPDGAPYCLAHSPKAKDSEQLKRVMIDILRGSGPADFRGWFFPGGFPFREIDGGDLRVAQGQMLDFRRSRFRA